MDGANGLDGAPMPPMGADNMGGDDPMMGDPNAKGGDPMGEMPQDPNAMGGTDDDELMNIVNGLSIEDKAAVTKYAKSMADDSEGEENIEYEENDSNSAESENDGNECENESKKKKKENDEYSKNELKEISPSFNVNNYRKICIRKLYKNNYEEKNNYKIQHFFKTIN